MALDAKRAATAMFVIMEMSPTWRDLYPDLLHLGLDVRNGPPPSRGKSDFAGVGSV